MYMICSGAMLLPPRPRRYLPTKVVRKPDRVMLIDMLDGSSEMLIPELVDPHVMSKHGSVKLGDTHSPLGAGDDCSRADAIGRGFEAVFENNNGALAWIELLLLQGPASNLKLNIAAREEGDSKTINAEVDPTEPTLPPPPMVLHLEPVLVKKHKHIRKGSKISVVQELVAECKVKFPNAKDTVANRKAIWRFGTQLCEHHGIRTQHTRKIMYTVVELVLTPDQWEIEAQQIAETRFIRTRRGNWLSLWHRFLNLLDNVSQTPIPHSQE